MKRLVLAGCIAAGLFAAGCDNPYNPPLARYEATMLQYENAPRLIVSGDLFTQQTIKTYEAPPLYPPEGVVPYLKK